jgi:putative redox protein
MEYKLEKPVEGLIGKEKYACTITWRNGKFISDEPEKSGGKDLGPDPYTLLISSLLSCTLVTLRMYIDRKGWDIPEMAVRGNMFQETKEEKNITVIDRDIHFLSPVTDEQKKRLQEIAAQCPVSKILEQEIHVRTFVYRDTETAEIKYANDGLTVVWRPDFCQHAKRCWTQLPQVFDPRIRKWINPDGAPGELIEEQVRRCPSGALGFFYNNRMDAQS